MSLPNSAKVTAGGDLDLIWHPVDDERSPTHKKGNKPPTAKPTASQNIVSKQCLSLFALIIGIDKYKDDSLGPLEGAIADAKAMKDYLEQRLGVPPSHIKTLFDEDATHDGIIQSLRALKDTDTERGDPILIYYAGICVTGDAPNDWEASGVALLAPYDMDSNARTSVVNAIPDYTIGILLEDLAKAKGDNITVVLDCSHSGSFSCSVGSSVVLAACGAEEAAGERNGRGKFTEALLATLSDVDPDKVTYADLIQRLPILSAQNPQCIGIHRDRILFDAKAPSQRRRLYAVHESDRGYAIDAGSAHGVTERAIFEIYKDRDPDSTTAPLEAMKASAPGLFSTVLNFSPIGRRFSIEDQAYALLIRAGRQEDLTLFVPLDHNLLPVFQKIATEMEDNAQRQINLLTDEDLKQGKTPDLGVAFENGHIVFDIKDPNVMVHGFKRMPQRVLPDINEVTAIIGAAAHYYWHLRRVGDAKYIKSRVEIEFTKLSDGDILTRKPDGPNLIKDGVVDIVVDEDDIYGMKITNHDGDPLYASVLYFDNSNWSITSYYQPSFAKGKLDPSILPNGRSLTIGYGAGGAQPFSYGLSDEQDIDVGCVKIFLSAEKVDLSSIPQPSPFNGSNRGAKRAKREPEWYSTLFTVVQRRYPRS